MPPLATLDMPACERCNPAAAVAAAVLVSGARVLGGFRFMRGCCGGIVVVVGRSSFFTRGGRRLLAAVLALVSKPGAPFRFFFGELGAHTSNGESFRACLNLFVPCWSPPTPAFFPPWNISWLWQLELPDWSGPKLCCCSILFINGWFATFVVVLLGPMYWCLTWTLSQVSRCSIKPWPFRSSPWGEEEGRGARSPPGTGTALPRPPLVSPKSCAFSMLVHGVSFRKCDPFPCCCCGCAILLAWVGWRFQIVEPTTKEQ
mmetsp:Transcript_10134/g.25300  ORF Transcript_10134/g.25300 Transcript_10134/m.25300 type:complete len:259 (-) Transcript_10134:92-868(-)